MPRNFPEKKLVVFLHPSKTAGGHVVKLLRSRGLTGPPEREAAGRDRSMDTLPRKEKDFVSYVEHCRTKWDFLGIEFDWPWLQKDHELFETFCNFREPVHRMHRVAVQWGASEKNFMDRLREGAEVPMLFPSTKKPGGGHTRTLHSNYYVRNIIGKSDPDVTMEDVELAMESVRKIDHVYIYEENLWQEQLPLDLNLEDGPPIPPRYEKGRFPTDFDLNFEMRELFDELNPYDNEFYQQVVEEFGQV